ncbi:phage tail tape measure protein, partial [Stenotrophomonas maltophilia]|nr:phage tail tape measure protein [Stenotrophomonas maltophilia]
MKSMGQTAAGVSKGIVAGFTAIGSVIGGAIAAFASVDAAITGLSNAINAADRIDELSARFSISTETLSGWGYAAKMTGSDLEGLVGIIPKFSKSIADASKAGSDADKTFRALGISVKDQAGNLRTFEDLLPEVQNRFAGISNETTKTALAMQLFGKSGSEFLEFLSLGADGMRTMEERARSLGIVIDSDTAGAAAEFNDRLDDLRAATQGWFTQLASELLPTLTDLTTQLVDVAKEGGGVRDVAHGIASAFREIGKAAEIFGVVEDWLDRLRGGLVAVEKQGNAVVKLVTGQYSGVFGSQGGGIDAFLSDYMTGTAYADKGWA